MNNKFSIFFIFWIILSIGTSTYFPMDVDAAKNDLIRIPNELRENNISEKDNLISELAESSPGIGIGAVEMFQEHAIEQIIGILIGLLILVVFGLVLWFMIIGITKLIQKKIRKIDVKLFKITYDKLEIKPYKIVYTNFPVEEFFRKISNKTGPGIIPFSNICIIVCFILMGFATWFLLDNISKFLFTPAEFSELTVLIPGVTISSADSTLFYIISFVIVILIQNFTMGILMIYEKIKINTKIEIGFLNILSHIVSPEPNSFEKTKHISKLRLSTIGISSVMFFSLVLGIIMLTNPFFALILPEPLLSIFYELPKGVLILSIIENAGADRGGLLENDIITHINGSPIRTPIDFPNLDPGETVSISILRDGESLDCYVEITASEVNPERGTIGIIRDNSFSYKPIMNFVEWDNHPHLSMFLLWLWLISFFTSLIGTLPLPMLNGGMVVRSIVERKVPAKYMKGVMWSIYSVVALLLIFNIVLSYLK